MHKVRAATHRPMTSTVLLAYVLRSSYIAISSTYPGYTINLSPYAITYAFVHVAKGLSYRLLRTGRYIVKH